MLLYYYFYLLVVQIEFWSNEIRRSGNLASREKLFILFIEYPERFFLSLIKASFSRALKNAYGLVYKLKVNSISNINSNFSLELL